MNVSEILKKIPKVELHTHLDGNIRPQTILDISKMENIHLPTYDINEFIHLIQVSPDCQSLKEYLSKFPFYIQVMQKPDYIYRVTYEYLADMSNQNVKYVEIRWAPFNHFENGMSFEEAVESCIEAINDARDKWGIICNLILTCMRNHSPETSMNLVEKGKKYLGKGVVAIDLAGNEADYPPEIHKEAFRRAKKYGYHITVHAGETGIPKNIITSVEDLYAERIGHGVTAYRDTSVFNFVKENKIPLEMCIVSNIQTRVETYESHPIKKFVNEGILVNLNTDSTTVSATTLEHTYKLLMDKKAFTLSDIKKCIMNGVDASFTDDNLKSNLKKLFLKEFNELKV